MPERTQCPHCGSGVGSADRFCSSCGRPLDNHESVGHRGERPAEPVICPSCGVLNPAANVRCFSCGSDLHEAVQRDEHVKTSRSAAAPKKSWKNSLSLQIVAAFAVFILIVVLIETQNRPTGNPPPAVNQQPTAPASSTPSGEMMSQIAMVEAAVKADPANADAALQLANLLHDAKFFPRAIETYKQFLKLSPKSTDARVDMAICYFETGDVKTAVQEIEKALRIDPKHQMAMFNLGVIHLSSNNVAESKKWLQQCIDLDPQSVAGQRAREILHQH